MSKKRNVYHYCSVETFFSIITNKCLRLSDLNKTNDYMEKKWVLKLIDKLLIDCLNEYNIKLDLNAQYWYEENINSHM